MADEIKIAMTGDSSALVAQFEKLHNVIAKITGDLGSAAKGARKAGEDTSKAYKEPEVQMKRLNDAATRLRKELETPYEQHKRELKEMSVLHRMGKLSTDEFNRAKADSVQRFRDATSSGRKYGITLGDINLRALGTAAAIRQVAAATREAQKAADESATEIDTLERRFRVQTGATEGDMATLGPQIQETAKRRAFTSEQAFVAATQLASSGMTKEQAAGEGLDAFLTVLAAANQTGKAIEPRQLAESIVSYMESQGLEKSGASILDVGSAVQRQFRGTNLQLEDLQALAGEGAGLASAMGWREQLAGMSIFRDVGMAGTEGATALRNVSGRLQTASASDQKVEALAQMGINPEEVDFVGETLIDVIDRLKVGLDSLREEDRAPVLKKIFEERGVAQVLALVGGRDKLQANVAMQQDRAGFESDAAVGMSGRAALVQRLKTEEQQIDASRGELDAAFRQALVNQMKADGINIAQRMIRSYGYDAMRAAGFSPETSAGLATDFGESGRRQFAGIRGRINEFQGPDGVAGVGPIAEEDRKLWQEQNRLLAENNELLRKQNGAGPQPAKPDVQPPGKRPAADRQAQPAGGIP